MRPSFAITSIYIFVICVDHNLQNQGIGKKLLDKLLEYSDKEIWTKIRNDNIQSINFFTKKGSKSKVL